MNQVVRRLELEKFEKLTCNQWSDNTADASKDVQNSVCVSEFLGAHNVAHVRSGQTVEAGDRYGVAHRKADLHPELLEQKVDGNGNRGSECEQRVQVERLDDFSVDDEADYNPSRYVDDSFLVMVQQLGKLTRDEWLADKESLPMTLMTQMYFSPTSFSALIGKKTKGTK